MIRVLTEPTSEPITLADARRWLGMTDDNDTDQDPEIWIIVQAMRRYAESYTGRRFVDTELELSLPCWPSVIALPVLPVVSIDYVKYVDEDGELQTLYSAEGSPTVGADLVDIDLKRERIKPAYGEVWPSIRASAFDPVRVGFTAGYGTGGSPHDLRGIPAELKLWIRRRMATLSENREEIIVGTIVAELPRHLCDAILDPLVLGGRAV